MIRLARLAMVFAWLASCNQSGKPPGQQVAGEVSKQHLTADGQPDFELTALDGQAIRFSALRTPVTVIGLWASWCVPCLLELPYLQALHRETRQVPDVQVLLLNVEKADVDGEVQRIRHEAKELGVEMPLLLDPQGALTRRIAPTIDLPQVVLIDRNFQVARLRGFPLGARPAAYVQTLLSLIDLARKSKLNQHVVDAFSMPCASTARPDAAVDPGAAIRILEDSLAQKPDDISRLMALAGLLERNGNSEEALKIWKRVSALDGQRAEALDGQARLLLGIPGKLAEAEQLSLRSLQLAPSNTDYLLTMGRIIARSAEPDKAVPFFRQALKSDPSRTDIALELGDILTRQGRLREANDLYRSTLQSQRSPTGPGDRAN